MADKQFVIPSYNLPVNRDSQLTGIYTQAMNAVMQSYLKDPNFYKPSQQEKWAAEFNAVTSALSNTSGDVAALVKEKCETDKPFLTRDESGRPVIAKKENDIVTFKSLGFNMAPLEMKDAGANGVCDNLTQRVVPREPSVVKERE